MTQKPNFLVIMSDQHAPDTVGGMGHPAVKTPALDRLMASGVTFRNAYCPYPMCTPARASFMTGQLTPAHGVWELGTPLASDLPTWAHVLRGAGYATSISGRMHFVGYDKMHGFEKRLHPEISPMLTPFAYGDWDKPQDDDHVMVGAVTTAGPKEEPTRLERYDEAAVEAAATEISRLASNSGDQPWALAVGTLLPHIPYAISRPYYDMYDGVEIPMPRPPPDGQNYEALCPAQLHGNRKWLGLSTDGASDAHIRMARRCYYGMITRLDELVGRLLSRLDETGAADNTWILYVSDHGDSMGEHGFWSKMNFYEDSVRVPFIVVPPRCAQAGAQCRAPVSLIDWMATVLDLTGDGAALGDLPGRSLLPLLEDPGQQWQGRTILSDYACNGTRVPMRMVRRDRWKACFASGFPPTLHDMEADPCEWNDLAGDPSNRGLLDDLERAARADGWNPEVLRNDILLHKRRLRYISEAENRT